ncbi:copper resistance protein CopC [Leucobacter weissii]|uniref:Copper resistance protein CopC n=1 Tax=Leucobacter weissii TaxID=1983706 RepID=A0A939MLU1_9MICO|nr:copper resistance CopC family protein [Leucobacter weissii]MBO1900997.1 copper resistance protein CopC [Leucobacter weissii]
MSASTHTAEGSSRALRGARLATAALGLAIGAALLGIVAAPAAHAHDVLTDTEFETNASTGAVEAIRLTFNNEVLPSGSEIVVTAPDGEDAGDGAPEAEGREVVQRLAPDLEPGRYGVAWRVVSSDGHPIEGAFSFDVDPGSTEPPEALPFSASEPDAPDERATAEQQPESVGDASAETAVWLSIAVAAALLIPVAAVAVVLLRKRRRSANSE